MSRTNDYVVARVHDDRYQIERTTPPGTGTAAFIDRVLDRTGGPLGWRLKPLVVMQGAKSRIWPSVADAIASTKLMTLREARTAVAAADKPSAADATQKNTDDPVQLSAPPGRRQAAAP
jgi:hypothetical protein